MPPCKHLLRFNGSLPSDVVPLPFNKSVLCMTIAVRSRLSRNACTRNGSRERQEHRTGLSKFSNNEHGSIGMLARIQQSCRSCDGERLETAEGRRFQTRDPRLRRFRCVDAWRYADFQTVHGDQTISYLLSLAYSLHSIFSVAVMLPRRTAQTRYPSLMRSVARPVG